MAANRQFVIDHLPTGKLTPDVFRAAEELGIDLSRREPSSVDEL